MGGSATAVTATAGIGTIGDTQQLQLHRTQKAGQPVSGADSFALTEHGSGSNSELTPLASAMSTAKTAMKSARRTGSMVYQSPTASSKKCGRGPQERAGTTRTPVGSWLLRLYFSGGGDVGVPRFRVTASCQRP